MAALDSSFSLDAELAVPVPLHAELRCEGGQLLALVGPSGSGKSTLLRLIAGLIPPARGSIMCGGACWFDGARKIHLSPQKRRVGYVPQHYGLFPHMSALANVMAGLHELPANEREARARMWMAKVHLGGLEQRRPAQLSGGQQQRVALARALAREPSILLLDEPFSAVDRATRETLYIELAELKQELSLPIVMVTHDLNEALLLAERITLLANGRTLQSGSPREVMARPVSEAAARLVGARNFFDGEVLYHDQERQLTWLSAGEQRLACPLSANFPPGSRVRWMVPGSAVRLPSLRRGELPAGINRVSMTVRAILPLGEEARITASLPGIPEPLHLPASIRLVNELNLHPDTAIQVQIRQQQIHIFEE